MLSFILYRMGGAFRMITFNQLQTLLTAGYFSRLSTFFTALTAGSVGQLAPVSAQPFSRFQTLLTAGHFVVSAEVTPPRHYKVDAFITSTEKIAACIDIVQVNDNVMAQARLCPLVAAQLMQRSGLEPVVQLTLRHRNRIALQSDLLGLAALGLRNVVVLGGSSCSIGSDPTAKDATDISTVDAIAALNRLTTQGQLFNGQIITPPPTFFIGAIATPTTLDLDASMAQLTAKIDSGAKYIQLQATFELETLEQWMAEVRARGLHQRAHFLASIYPFSCLKALERFSEIPGLSIPESLRARLSHHGSRSECWKINRELILGIRAIEGIRGLHLRSLQPRDWLPQISDLLRVPNPVAVDVTAIG